MILSADLSSTIEQRVDTLLKSDFVNLLPQEKFDHLCRLIYDFIDQMPKKSFALISVLKLIHLINKANLLDTPLRFNNFELWLNALGNISENDNIRLRSKIAGRFLPRDEYQAYFPLTTNKHHWGSHIVTGHSSPDLDTAVASFWSWVDAFAARIGTGLHIWNLPGSRLSDHDARIFSQYFEEDFFHQLPKGREMLTLQAIDLMTPNNLLKLEDHVKVSSIDSKQFEQGIIVVDSKGYYKGDWRQNDVESVRQITDLLNNLLRSFESHLNTLLISLFAKTDLKQKEIQETIDKLLNNPLNQCEAFKDFTATQKHLLESYLQKILKIKEGTSASFYILARSFSHFSYTDLELFFSNLSLLIKNETLFDTKGDLIENRTALLTHLESSFENLHKAVHAIREFTDTLKIALRIKHQVLETGDEHVSSKAELDEIKKLMRFFRYLTVVHQEKSGDLIPIGAIYNETLQKKSFGTVSLRDFSNRDEVKIADYLEVISIVDHHKSDIKTLSAAVAVISNTQSCNTLLAEMQMTINDRYSHGGQTLETVQHQIETLSSKKNLTFTEKKQLIRLMKRESVMDQNFDFFVHPEREAMEYTMYLYAILDDTDLLAKVGPRDLRVVCEIINRLETLKTGKDEPRLFLEDIENSSDFLAKARNRILQDKAMYNLYSQFYAFKESSIKEQIILCQKQQPNTLFCDTKTQNGCARVGQVKLTKPLVSFFKNYNEDICKRWLEEAMAIHQSSQEIDLHIQMISTIAGAEDVYAGLTQDFTHQDKMWIWSPLEARSTDHLITFLRGLRWAKEIEKLSFEVEVISNEPERTLTLIEQNFAGAHLSSKKDSSIQGALFIFHFKAGALNSRKAIISPYLPVL